MHLYIPYRENKNPTGTACYMSIDTHLGVEQACKDDPESLAYVLMYYPCGAPPLERPQSFQNPRVDGEPALISCCIAFDIVVGKNTNGGSS